MPRLKKKYTQPPVAQTPEPTGQHDCIQPRYLTLEQAAKYMGYRTKWVIYRWVKAGRLRVLKENKAWIVSKCDLDEFFEKNATRFKPGSRGE